MRRRVDWFVNIDALKAILVIFVNVLFIFISLSVSRVLCLFSCTTWVSLFLLYVAARIIFLFGLRNRVLWRRVVNLIYGYLNLWLIHQRWSGNMWSITSVTFIMSSPISAYIKTVWRDMRALNFTNLIQLFSIENSVVILILFCLLI